MFPPSISYIRNFVTMLEVFTISFSSHCAPSGIAETQKHANEQVHLHEVCSAEAFNHNGSFIFRSDLRWKCFDVLPSSTKRVLRITAEKSNIKMIFFSYNLGAKATQSTISRLSISVYPSPVLGGTYDICNLALIRNKTSISILWENRFNTTGVDGN